MKKFKFRLERVLQYRQAVREEKKRALALANSELQAEEMQLAEYEEEQRKSTVPMEVVCDVNEFLMVGLYRQRLKELIVNQCLAIIRAKEKVESALQEYVEAAKEAKALEMLREKRLQEYQEYVAKEEGKFLDEMVTQRIGRQMMEEK